MAAPENLTHSATDWHTEQPRAHCVTSTAPLALLLLEPCLGEKPSAWLLLLLHMHFGVFELLLTNKSVRMKNKPLKNPSLFTPGSLVFLQTVRLSRLFTGNGSIGRTFCCADEILKSCFLLRSKSLFPLHGFTELLFTCFPLNRKIPSLFHFYGKNVRGIFSPPASGHKPSAKCLGCREKFPRGTQ